MSAGTQQITVATASGERIALTGRRADVLAAIAVELAKRPYLDDAEVFDVQAHTTPGQIVIRAGDTAPPYKRRWDDLAAPVAEAAG